VRQQQDMFWRGRRSAAEPGPALLRVAIAAEADCLPMFPPGGAARAMIG
jgi:acetolactate synthase-1/2/3 large subunit